MPKVSVMVLTHKRPEVLKKALLSVAAQTFKDFEIVIGDNHSEDNTKEIAEEFINQGLQVKYLYHNPEVSITENRQRVLLASAGDYVAPLDDDDLWNDPNKLKKQVEFLDIYPEIVIVGGGINLSNEPEALKIEKFRVEIDGQIRKTMLLRNNFFTSTVMFRRAAAVEAGGFEFFENDYAEDYYLWLRLGLLGKMHNLQEVFATYSKPNYSKQKIRGFFIKQLHLIEKFKKKLPQLLFGKIIVTIKADKKHILTCKL